MEIQPLINFPHVIKTQRLTLPLDTDIDRSAFEGTIVKYIVKKSHRGTYNNALNAAKQLAKNIQTKSL